MLKLFHLLFLICILRADPQDLPYNPRLKWSLLSFYLLSGLLALSPALPWPQGLNHIVVDLILLTLFTRISLVLVDKQPRFEQAFCALLGVGALYQLVAWPLIAQIEAARLAEQVAVNSSMLLLMLLLWHITVFSHIMRNALDVPRYVSIALAVGYMFLSVFVNQLMFPGS